MCWNTRALAWVLASVSLAALPNDIYRITPYNVAHLSSNLTALNSIAAFQVYRPDFLSILGPNPTLTLLLTSSLPLFHEAGVYFSSSPPTIFITSDQINTTNSPNTDNKRIQISKLTQAINGTWSISPVTPTGDDLGGTTDLFNGGFKYQSGVLFAAQGNLVEQGGLILVDANHPYRSKVLIDNYLGLPFNSPNDVHVIRNGLIWFTDPPYGSEQGIRPAPNLPSQVYVFNPGTTEIRVVSDDFSHPNGITFSPDERTCYITDTAGSDGNFTNPRTIYAFDVKYRAGAPFLTGKRVFALAAKGIPDGIKCDSLGNVYSGTGDGINVWSPGGVLLGKIIVENVANFAFGPDGQIFVLASKKLYLAQLDESVQPAVL